MATYTSKDDAEVDANGVPLYGLDKELAAKKAAKYDPVMEAQARDWVNAIAGPLGGVSTTTRTDNEGAGHLGPTPDSACGIHGCGPAPVPARRSSGN